MRDSRLRWSILNTLMILGFAMLIVIVFYFLDLWILERTPFMVIPFSLTECFLFQGIILLLLGLMALLGRIKEIRQRGRPISMSKYFWGIQVYTWAQNGYLRLGLTLTYSGATMILIYFLNL